MKRISRLVLTLAAFIAACACDSGDYMGGIMYDFPSANAYYKMDGDNIEEPPMPGDRFDEIVENGFIKVSEQPVSTFSIDADGASYAYMRRCIGSGYLPNPSSVRTEEFLNYFTFDYPEPADEETVAINSEIGVCPWNTEHYLLRLGLKGKSIAEADMPVANYILLVDTSGSMSGTDRIELLKSGLCNMNRVFKSCWVSVHHPDGSPPYVVRPIFDPKLSSVS